MKIFSTRGYLELPEEDEMRSNGCIELVVLENESGTIQVQMTVDELDCTGIDVDGDVISDEVMTKMVASLVDEGFLEQPI
jgi:hypothetical protein